MMEISVKGIKCLKPKMYLGNV